MQEQINKGNNRLSALSSGRQLAAACNVNGYKRTSNKCYGSASRAENCAPFFLWKCVMAWEDISKGLYQPNGLLKSQQFYLKLHSEHLMVNSE